jgi:hypothetical protein
MVRKDAADTSGFRVNCVNECRNVRTNDKPSIARNKNVYELTFLLIVLDLL